MVKIDVLTVLTLRCLAVLLRVGAEKNKANELGETPLFLAAQEGRRSCVQALLQAGANRYQAENSSFQKKKNDSFQFIFNSIHFDSIHFNSFQFKFNSNLIHFNSNLIKIQFIFNSFQIISIHFNSFEFILIQSISLLDFSSFRCLLRGDEARCSTALRGGAGGLCGRGEASG